MSQDIPISKGKVVYITYSIRDQAGNFFEQSDMPVGYIQGAERGLFNSIEAALEGKTIGAETTQTLEASDAFGAHDPELTFEDDLDNVPEQFRQIGAEVQFQNEQGDVKTFMVAKIENGRVTIDGNHPLAGQRVTFHVSVVGVREATAQELARGEPAELDDSFAGSLH